MKYLKQNEKKPINWLLIGLCGVIVLALILAALYLDGREDTQAPTEDPGTTEQTQPTQTDPPTEETQPQFPALTLPYTMEDGKLTIDAFFQFTGLNPDKNDEEAEDVAAIQITNTSQEHLTSVTLSVVTTDGSVVKFTATDIPGGMSAMVFELDNVSVPNDITCSEITCEASFEAQKPVMADKIEISVEGTEITVRNISGEDLNLLTVYYHSVLDQSYYGGITYQYTIDSLPAGESTVVDAWECILGLTDVVRVELENE